MAYSAGDIVLYFKQEAKQIDPNVGLREFAFILVSTKNNNTSTPRYVMVDGIPDFTKTGWNLINPTSYLLQDLVGMRKVVKEVFEQILSSHMVDEHGTMGVQDIKRNLLRKDYANLATGWLLGNRSVDVLDDSGIRMKSNGTMEVSISYSFDVEANPEHFKIEDKRYYYQKSPIWDESDHTIFASKYMEDDLFSVVLKNGISFTNLRYGTNIFHARIDLSVPFANDEYMIFFDTYGNGEFVFGYDKADIQGKEEPTYDAIVSMPMVLNKSAKGFDIILPIHTHFNSIQKYQIGLPWKNLFRLQLVGMYR